MKRHLSFLLFTSILYTSGCWSSTIAEEHPLHKDVEEPIIVLFSDEHSLREESSFYDALLELQQIYPDVSVPLKIVYGDERGIIRHYDIMKYPTMLILNQGGIKLRIEGSHPKEDIVYLLKQTLYNIEEGSLSN